MSEVSELVRLARWGTWANQQVLETLRASAGEPPKALAAFQHVFETELVWLRRMQNETLPMLRLWGSASMQNCEQWAVEAKERWTALMTSLASDADLDRTFSYRNSTGAEFVDGLRGPLWQTLTHSSQYRGEAAGFLNDAGHRVPDLDFIFWLRLGSPE